MPAPEPGVARGVYYGPPWGWVPPAYYYPWYPWYYPRVGFDVAIVAAPYRGYGRPHHREGREGGRESVVREGGRSGHSRR